MLPYADNNHSSWTTGVIPLCLPIGHILQPEPFYFSDILKNDDNLAFYDHLIFFDKPPISIFLTDASERSHFGFVTSATTGKF